MPQEIPVTITENPVDISDALEAGDYAAQARGGSGEVGVLYASALTIPASDDDYFQCRAGDFFYFSKRGTPVWVKSAGPGDTVLALASY